MENMNENTKIVLITGSGAGIGYTTAIYFAEKNYQVIATMRNKNNELFKKHSNIEVIELDVTKKESIKKCIDSIISKYGKIDILINNAGIGIYKPFELINETEIKQLFDTNLFGIFNICKEVLPIMRKQNSGVIINVSSVVGIIAMPFYTIYCSTKFALEGFSEALHYETLPFNIKIKIIEPGAIKTEFFANAYKLADKINKSNKHNNNENNNVNNDINNTTIENDYKVHFRKIFEKQIGKGITNPKTVAKVIYKASTDKNNKLRYTVGVDSKIGIGLRKILPQRLFFKLLLIAKKERDKK